MLIEIEPAWRPSKFEPGGLVQTRPVPVWVWGWLEASGFLQMVPEWRLRGCNLWAGLPDLGASLGLGEHPRTPHNTQIVARNENGKPLRRILSLGHVEWLEAFLLRKRTILLGAWEAPAWEAASDRPQALETPGRDASSPAPSGLPRSPQLPVGLGSAAGRLWAPEEPRLPASLRSTARCISGSVRVQDLRLRVPCSGLRVCRPRLKVWGSRLRVPGLNPEP